ncbi:hypothetical protein COV17_03660 [Candidatus Woesearchaeota archaeon CG10_big_fil_rev_8_21_14_0_10_36_11]|nr:MAG: hypothetical protein COV17_03660 [Candidatus Woesearchaeota archaeon CG10_big_fil_rev_8_21_14_0_10_36_11]
MTQKTVISTATSVNLTESTIPNTPPDIFAPLLKTVYQLVARDYIDTIFYLLGDTPSRVQLASQIPNIHTDADFATFLSSLPSATELADIVKQDIRAEYATLDTVLAENETRRATALAGAQIDFSEYVPVLLEAINRQLQVSLPSPKRGITTKDGFDTYRSTLEGHVSDAITAKLTSPFGNGMRIGDILTVTRMSGLTIDDDGEMADEFHYGGNQDDIPLGLEGELVNIIGKDSVFVRFTRDGDVKEWQFYPDEITSTGRNTYQEYLTKFGGDVGQAASTVIATAEFRLISEYLQRAQERVNNVFDANVSYISDSIRRRFALTDDQLTALVAGDDFEYTIDDVKEGGQVVIPFERLAVLAYRALTHKLGKDTKRPNQRIVSEADFRRFISDSAIKLRAGEDTFDLVKEQMKTLAVLLEKEYSVVGRRMVQESKETQLGRVLDLAIESWIDREHQSGCLGVKYSFDRALLYNDRKVYTAEPFSPPSEELHRVIKLEMGNGCSYAKCTYCTEYGQARFFLRSPDDFKDHVQEVKRKLGRDIKNVERVFLAGGSILSIPTKILIQYVDIARKAFHNQRTDGDRTYIRRIAAFTRTEGLARKSVQELDELVSHGLNMVFWGIETGADSVLQYVNKGITHDEMIAAGSKMPHTRMEVSTMVMTGLGGLKHYENHVVQTAKLLNALQPRYITFMTINAQPHSMYAHIMAGEQARGENMPLTPEMVVEQMYDIVSLIDPRLWSGRRCLVAAYQLPVERIAENPVQFRGRLEYNDKTTILRGLQDYFTRGRTPSELVPVAEFNQKSPLRRMVVGDTPIE